jgi:hypothetical protein
MTRKRPRPPACCALLIVAAAGGCAMPLKIRDQVTIDSQPQGARVFVGGKDVGSTPVTLNLDEAFPRHWTGRLPDEDAETTGFSIYRRLETVDLKKDGCDIFTRQYRESDLARDINAVLKCDPNRVPAPAAAPGASESVEQRLRELERLKRDGLITDEEYADQRRRILNAI